MATCGSALCGIGRAMAGGWCWRRPFAGLKGVSSLHRWLFDGFWYCEELEREQVPHPRLDVLFFLKMCSFNSSEYSFTFMVMSFSLGLSALINAPIFPSLSLLTLPHWPDGR